MLPNYFNPNEVPGLKDYLDKNVIDMNFLAGTTVTVTQSKSGSNAYSADATIKLNLNKSQLNDDLVLTVNGIAYRISEEAAKKEGGKVLEFDESGNVKDIELKNIQPGAITLQLVGKQHIELTNEDIWSGGVGSCGLSIQFDNDVDLTAKIHVAISEIKGDKVYEQFKGSENEEETKTFKRTDTVTESESTLTTTVTDVAAGTKNDTTTQPVPDDGNEDDGDNNEDDGNNNNDNTPTTPGDGPANNNTNNVVVADPDVPLAEIPETEVPLAEIPDMEVPLADAPVEMDIPDEAVPMADVPAEVVIVDDAVPLADVPKTGDTSDIWYAAAVLSLGGWMLVSGRKREEEDA